MPAFKHSRMQLRISNLIDAQGGFVCAPELTLRMREGKYVVPGVRSRGRLVQVSGGDSIKAGEIEVPAASLFE